MRGTIVLDAGMMARLPSRDRSSFSSSHPGRGSILSRFRPSLKESASRQSHPEDFNRSSSIRPGFPVHRKIVLASRLACGMRGRNVRFPSRPSNETAPRQVGKRLTQRTDVGCYRDSPHRGGIEFCSHNAPLAIRLVPSPRRAFTLNENRANSQYVCARTGGLSQPVLSKVDGATNEFARSRPIDF